MKHLSLFSGIGGLDLAAEWAGFETVAFVERDPYCQRVLAKRWPGVPIIGDVRAVTGADVSDATGKGGSQSEQAVREHDERLLPGRAEVSAHPFGRGEVGIVSGGFPCQPHSVAGKRQASADDRDLWPEVARVLREIRPRWFVGENVRGLLHSESGRFFGSILGDLADLGYRVGWGVWGASDVGALHQRERVFIVAYAPWDLQPERQEGRPERERAGARGEPGAMADPLGLRELQPERREREVGGWAGDGGEDVPNADRGGLEERQELDGGAASDTADWRSRWEHVDGHRSTAAGWQLEPDVGRVVAGAASRVDRLRALGNCVVPQQAYPLFAEIARIERMKTEQYLNSLYRGAFRWKESTWP